VSLDKEGVARLESNEKVNKNDIVLRMRRIFCCSGAEFTRRELQAGWEEIEKLRALLKDIAASGVEFQHPSLKYLVVQIDRETWEAIQEEVKKLMDGGNLCL